MCLIVTIILLGLSIQNLIAENWFIGFSQLIISLGFVLLLIKNIRDVKAMKNGITCDKGCSVTHWIGNLFKKKEN